MAFNFTSRVCAWWIEKTLRNTARSMGKRSYLITIWFNFNFLIQTKELKWYSLEIMLCSNMLQVKQVVSAALQFCSMFCNIRNTPTLINHWKRLFNSSNIFIYRIFNGRQPSLVIHDPELLKCVFVKNNHDFPNRRVRFLWINDNLVGNYQC